MNSIDITLPEIRGEYTITKRRYGKITQQVTFTNLVTYTYLAVALGNTPIASYCRCGSGSTAPNVNDTQLTNFLWSRPLESSTYTTSQDKLSRTWHLRYIFPANSSYEGTIREVGLTQDAYDRGLMTHALVTDAEHNPIEIEKTYLDEVTINVAFTITRPSWQQSGIGWCFGAASLAENRIRNLILKGTDTTCVSFSPTWAFDFTPIKLCDASRVITALHYDSTLHNFSGSYEYDPARSYTDYVNSLCIGGGGNGSNSSSGSGNIAPAFRVLMPNINIFPVTTLEGLALGTGDGVTTDFAPTVPAWVANSEVVYADGVALTRGVDYLVDNVSNLSVYKSVMLSTFLCDLDAIEVVTTSPSTGIWGTGCVSMGPLSNHEMLDYYLDVDHPMIFTYATTHAFSDKANVYRLGNWTASAAIAAGAALVFYYSLDNQETWVEFARINHTANNADFNDSTQRTLASTVSGITNVKVALENTDSTARIRNNCDNRPYYHNANANGYFGYVGEYAIRFLTPPAQDSVLTMDIDIDRPWKDNTINMQWNPTFSFTL